MSKLGKYSILACSECEESVCVVVILPLFILLFITFFSLTFLKAKLPTGFNYTLKVYVVMKDN